ncbi:hypothetical protein E2C01_017827 [Portunus trituberculatus]|uniref:Uncharacterized protein n=1 Tax=Portunus trituberculatus TaxID=210409 RepID=A0A5B7DUV3_PORTR|nr:hypothetical protein [Portunus trituberculatus]
MGRGFGSSALSWSHGTDTFAGPGPLVRLTMKSLMTPPSPGASVTRRRRSTLQVVVPDWTVCSRKDA